MEILNAVTSLSALAHEKRLTLFRELVKAGPDGLAAGVIASRLETPANTLSFHLNHLKQAGLIASRRESRQIFYSANYASMQKLLDYLYDDCCMKGQKTTSCRENC